MFQKTNAFKNLSKEGVVENDNKMDGIVGLLRTCQNGLAYFQRRSNSMALAEYHQHTQMKYKFSLQKYLLKETYAR